MDHEDLDDGDDHDELFEGDDDDDGVVQEAAAQYAEVIAAQATADAAPNDDYRKARDSELLDVRTRQLKALQQDYLRLHEHTLLQAQRFTELSQQRDEELQRVEASRDAMRKQLADVRSKTATVRSANADALTKCEKMLARLACVRGVDQLPHEMAAASAMLFEVRTLLLQSQEATQEAEERTGPSAAAVRSAFESADTNHDRKLDRKEFRVLMSKQFGAAAGKTADALFDDMDRDKSGFIDFKEFQRAAKGGRMGRVSTSGSVRRRCVPSNRTAARDALILTCLMLLCAARRTDRRSNCASATQAHG